MKICVATDAHKGDDQRINKEIKSLKKIGEVIFIHPEDSSALVNVKEVMIKRYSSRKERFLKGPKEVYKEVLKINPDFFHFHDPELMPIAKKLAKKGIKVIYDVHENYPAVILTKYYIPKWLRKIISKMVELYENNAAKKFYGVVVVTENMCERFSKFTRCVLVPNYPDLEILKSIEYSKRSDGKIRFVYSGSIDEDRAIIEMLEAYKKLSEKRNDVEFLMFGPVYSTKIQDYLKTYKANGFIYHPPVSYKESLKMIAESDIGMLVIHRNESKEISSPVKMLEYLYFNLPIVASDFPYWKKILDEECATFVEPDDVESIYSGMKKAISMIGKYDCRKIAEKHSWNVCENNLISLYLNHGKSGGLKT